MADNTEEDLVLARQVESGNEAALDVLYGRYADPLFAFIYHHMGTREDTEDIWQETWLAVVRSLPAYQGHSRLFTWLCSIARHKMADHCRRRGRTIPVLSELPPEDLGALMDCGPLPEDIVVGSATRVRVVEALADLPDEYRTALVARYAEGEDVDRVATTLGKTYKATESVLSRAKVAFRKALARRLDKEE